MEANKRFLIETLDALYDEEFERFKSEFQRTDNLEGLKAIPCWKLKKANREDTIDLIAHTYTKNTLKLTKNVLEKINRNDLMEMLSPSSSGLKGTSWGEKNANRCCRCKTS